LRTGNHFEVDKACGGFWVDDLNKTAFPVERDSRETKPRCLCNLGKRVDLVDKRDGQATETIIGNADGDVAL